MNRVVILCLDNKHQNNPGMVSRNVEWEYHFERITSKYSCHIGLKRSLIFIAELYNTFLQKLTNYKANASPNATEFNNILIWIQINIWSRLDII